MGVVVATLLLGVIICANGHNCNHASGEHDFLERAISPQVNKVLGVGCTLFSAYTARMLKDPNNSYGHVSPYFFPHRITREACTIILGSNADN